MVATINGKEHSIKIVGLKNSILEFILDNSYRTAKILEFGRLSYQIVDEWRANYSQEAFKIN